MDEMQAKAEWIHAALDRHGVALTRYAASIVNDADTARDVVQDTFLRLCHESPARLDGHLAEWLYTVCRNRALDMNRKLCRLTPLSPEEGGGVLDPDPTPAAAAEQQDTVQLALSLLRLLPPRQQELVRLKFQGGLSYEEIGRVTHLSVSNVGFLLHTALRTLRQRLEKAL
jgi:RNA polymerase sigma factor (sigma-70 family)